MMVSRGLGRAAAFAAALALAACSNGPPRERTGSVSVSTVSLMNRLDMPRTAPIMIRLFKEEAVLEVWKQERDGRYGWLRSYPICRFSGQLGPKRYEGDRQAPEGFYEVTTRSLNPASRNYLAFNVGFPNALDRQLGRSGTNLMVHGGCKSVGCYAMTHRRIEEIYALVREALLSGQDSVPFEAFPFRMTEENLARHAADPNIDFWRQLKQGSDLFATTRRPPIVAACNGRYGFAPGGSGAQGPAVCAAQSYASAAPSPVQASYAQTPYDDAGGYQPQQGGYPSQDDGPPVYQPAPQY